MFRPRKFKDKQKEVIVFRGLCKGCGLCLVRCPQKAISFSSVDLGVYSTPSVEINLEKCNACGLCEIICPDCAIKIDKKK